MRFPLLLALPCAVAFGPACGDTGVPFLGDPDEPPVTPLPPTGDFSDREPRPEGPFRPAPARLRRLLKNQYQNAVADLLGPAAAQATTTPPDVPLNGSVSVGAGDLAIAPAAVETYEASAVAAAAAAVADPSSPVHAVCAPSSSSDVACYRQIAERLGRRAFRRTLEGDEVERLAALAVQAAQAYEGIDAAPTRKGLEFLLQALLQSPHFLYMVERGEPGDDPAARRLTGTELATRLSFFLTGAPPDEELLDAAEAGALSSPTTLEATARAMLADPRAKEALRAYFVEKLQLDQLSTLNRPDPALTPSVRAAMIEESLLLIDDVVWERDADVRELLTSTDTFVNDELASYYGFPLPGSGTAFTRVATPAEEDRAGLFTRGAFLVRFAHPNRSSPTLRGKFIREQLLCAAVPAPPDNVVTTLPEEAADGLPRTTRDRVSAHMTEPVCAACHRAMDPLGFAFEHFDQFGRYRSHENGLPVDASNAIDGDAADGASGFMDILDGRADMVSCLVRGLYRHGVGRMEEEGQYPSLYDVDTAFYGSGLRLQEALVAIVLSDAFRFVNTEDEE